MATKQINPTRMELKRLKNKLLTARRGHKLLKDKRDELMRQFLNLVKETKLLRIQVESALNISNTNFLLARSEMTGDFLDVALLAPKQEINLDISFKNIMSVNVPILKYRMRAGNPNDIYSYGFVHTSADLDIAIKSLYEILPQLLNLAQNEKAIEMLSEEIEKTRRRVNALEHILIPETQAQIKFIIAKLDETERSTNVRLMKLKDLILKTK